MKIQNSESGSAIVYVFIGVALFGALMFLFSRGASQNSTSMSSQSANISASSYIEESRIIESATQKLLANGCSEKELSFDIPPYTANTNTNAPIDMHCHIFHPAGGKLNATAFNPNWIFSSKVLYPNIGTSEPELGAYVWGVDTTVCQKINDLLKNNLTTIPAVAGVTYSASFDGTFSSSPYSLTLATDISSGCYLPSSGTPPTKHVFFKALIIR